MLISRNTLVVSFTAFAVLQLGIGINSTPNTCVYNAETIGEILSSIAPTNLGSF